MSVVIMLLVIAGLSVASSTKEQRAEATGRWDRIGKSVFYCFTLPLCAAWYFVG